MGGMKPSMPARGTLLHSSGTTEMPSSFSPPSGCLFAVVDDLSNLADEAFGYHLPGPPTHHLLPNPERS